MIESAEYMREVIHITTSKDKIVNWYQTGSVEEQYTGSGLHHVVQQW